MTDIADRGTADEAITELRDWLRDNWDPDLTVGEWWERLGNAGWSAPTLPVGSYGRGVERAVAVEIAKEISAHGALGAPGGLGLLLAAPTIADEGTPEQVETYVGDIVTGRKGWCQLFSEPSAGSDLAGLATKAVRDGDEWVINGQKVWTSLGQYADLGMLLARTDPDQPKHRGITYFAIEMLQPGIEVRPLHEMTGNAMFNEVFMTDARVADAAIIGGLNNGWRVANTTLGHERAGLGAGGGSAGGGLSGARPGTIAGDLEKRAGDFVRAPKKAKAKGEGADDSKRRGGSSDLLAGIARGNGKIDDPVIRQDLARLHTYGEIGRYGAERAKALRAQGKSIPGMGNIAKLSMSNIMRLQRDLGLAIVGAQGMLHAYDPKDQQAIDDATGNPFLAGVTGIALYAQAPPIYGGTDQIQRNILSERVLGLPREQGPAKDTPYSELPKNG